MKDSSETQEILAEIFVASFRSSSTKTSEPAQAQCTTFAGGHTAPNTPDLFRTPKLTVAGPGQY